MIPIKDDIPLRQYPFITLILIQVNVLVFLIELQQGDNILSMWYNLAVIPERLMNWPADPLSLITLFTSQFLHGGWFHLLSNMLFLWVFGRKVEGDMGPWRFLFFYLVGGALAAVLEVMMTGPEEIYMLGASGAIAAALGAYLFFFPHARVWVWTPAFWLGAFPLPAFVVLGLWFVLQFANGVLALGPEGAQAAGTAWWAHVGGFLTGLAAGPRLRIAEYRRQRNESRLLS